MIQRSFVQAGYMMFIIIVASLTASLAFAAPATLESPEGAKRLSEPGKVSRWAFVYDRAYAYTEPSRSSAIVTRLKTRTEDRTNELVLLLESVQVGEQEWVRVRLPIRPNGSTGWVRRESIGQFHTVRTWLTVNRKTFTARLVKNGRTIFRARVGVGKRQWPTPSGDYYIRTRLRGFDNNPMYGPLVFGTSAMSVLTDWPGGGVVGIHGTNQPGLLPGRVSHGCIRMRNSDILRLGKLMPVGTPLTIR